jgi:hypothetical protein
MTVAELISRLQEQDGNDKVAIWDTDASSYYEMDWIAQLPNGFVEIGRNYNKSHIEELT